MRHSLLVAGTRSGCGKTTLTLCLLAALQRRGLAVQACKTGPDFIDPTHHAVLTGRPSYNVDAWMGGHAGLMRVYARMQTVNSSDMLLAEGAMGLFDGAEGLGGPGSAAHAAHSLNMPVLLAVDVRGMGQSAAALAAGYVRQDAALRFAGLVCTHVGSQGHADMLREAFAAVFEENDPPLLGLLPRAGVPELPSRHLGLIMAHERPWNEATREAMADWVEEHMDVDALLARCPTPQDTAHSVARCTALTAPPASTHTACKRPRIGIARDEAFCFLYPDMPDVLEELGAECVFFSPLRDTAPPENCAALYFPGGYPELHASALSANASMRERVHNFAQHGRIYAECGGYMYLMHSLSTAEGNFAMSHCLPLSCRMGESKAALGYREVSLHGQNTCVARGHEFHYARLQESTTLAPLWDVRDRTGKILKGESCGVAHGHVLASWIHLYPEGSRELLARIFNLNPEIS